MTDTTLTARENAYGWSVIDPTGGRWWPNLSTHAAIKEATDPAARAVEICETQPMRGEWRA